MDRPIINYYLGLCGQSRDSSVLERSNFICILEHLGSEAETIWETCFNDQERLEYIREHSSEFDSIDCITCFNSLCSR